METNRQSNAQGMICNGPYHKVVTESISTGLTTAEPVKGLLKGQVDSL